MRVVRVVVAMLVACAGCAAPVAPPPAPAGITLVPRPRDIRIDDVAPCSLLTPEQRTALRLDGEPGDSTDDGQFLGPTRNCTQLGFGTPNIAISIALARAKGIERYTVEGSNSAVSPLVVEGFPAVVARPQTSLTDFCTVALDVAPGQLVDVQFRDGGGGQPKIPMDELCAGARATASDVMQTLLRR